MSEHRRKPPQPQGGRAAARRAAQQPGRRPAPARDVSTGSPSDPYGEERPHGGRAEARRAAQRGGRRRSAGGAGGAGGPGGGRRGTGGPGGRGSGGGRPGRKRLIDYPRHDRYGWRRWVPSWKLVAGLCLGFVASMMGAATIAYATVKLPDQAKAATAENNVYYWADGSQMAATGGEVNRQIIDYSEIPMAIQDAVVSAENKTFWKDAGIDPMGIGRALFNMATGGQTQGGSTITQQYVKNNRLNDQSQTLERKLQELFISIRVNNELTKKEIMAGYLNTSYFGRGAYGIQAAARTYFGKDASQLDESQCAFLASLLKGSTYYDPAGAPEIDPKATAEANTKRVTERWSWILDEMVKDGKLSAARRASFTALPGDLKPPQKQAKLGGQVGYLVDLAKAYFINNNDHGITAEDLSLGGYEIRTTFDKKRVEALDKTIKKVYEESIDPEKRPETDTHVQFGGASVDPETGAIVAIYGGTDATKHFTNNADQTGAQVGSTFKPFVLAAGMKYGVRDPRKGPEQGPEDRTPIDPDTAIYNGKNKLKIRQYNGSIWKDENDREWLQVNDNDESYPDINLREAMIHSANSPFVQLGMDIGIKEVRKTAIEAGLLESSLAKGNVPSFSIGTSDPSAIRMASAYATFASNGEQRDPYSVTEVKKKGAVIYKHEDRPRRAFSTAVSSNVTDVLVDVVEKGTGKKARLPDRPAAGKTGTTDGNKSAWFVGYTPQLVTAIDMYRLDDDASNKDRKFEEMFGTGGRKKVHGSSFPSEIWKAYMTEAHKGMPVERFPAPEDLSAQPVYGGGAESPEPTPTEEPSQSPTPKPTPTPTTPTPSPSEKPEKPGKSCGPLDWDCDPESGGTTEGGTTEGGADSGGTTGSDGGVTEGGTTEGGETSPSPPDDGNGNGNGSGSGGGGGSGGWFGGVDG
ncbi:transglycosylase domain-containing protein [Streptomyces sudanensis]|uniref:transglycosylase domain-containing protein n=1 Tax=Streptomyces sudanensis TaxID=436397 RepID=UPI0020CDC130|nr:transglycosylase domain-containing protein [Streptomyces sudanensis]MCP9958199.1 penicillin-binding protein [Streptomyces sudanensis]MCQ0001280.1 penicillin-binding protein [Streptomyces sudanensis]